MPASACFLCRSHSASPGSKPSSEGSRPSAISNTTPNKWRAVCKLPGATAENYILGLGQPPDLLVVDPPRAGLGKEAAARVLKLRPAHLTIVSCDPATLARDARQLLEQYTIRRLALIDLFPQTFHFETVMHLDLR